MSKNEHDSLTILTLHPTHKTICKESFWDRSNNFHHVKVWRFGTPCM